MARPSSLIRNLVVMTWNANGLSGRITELKNFLTENNIDVILIQESRLRNKVNHNIPNYHMYYNNRQNSSTRWGGTAIYVRNGLSHYEVKDINVSALEHTTIIIKIDDIKLQISSAYVNLGLPFPSDDITNILNKNNKSLLAGDLNAHHTSWNCYNTNPRGTALLNVIRNNNFKLITPPPTRTSLMVNLPLLISLSPKTFRTLSKYMSLTSLTPTTCPLF